MAMNDVYFFVYVNTLKKSGGGGGVSGPEVKNNFLSKEQFYFLQQLHQLNYSNIDTFININKQNQK